MRIPAQIDIERIKTNLKEKGKLLDINNSEDKLMVACFLHDLLDDFTIVYEDESNTDPYMEISESQYTSLHRLFRQVLRSSQAFHFSNRNFWELNRCLEATVAGLLQVCAVEKYKAYRQQENKSKQ